MLTSRIHIAGYCRISAEEQQNGINSIESQMVSIMDFVNKHFPDTELTLFTDRNCEAFRFEDRAGYQEMRSGLTGHRYDVLVVKDFSRFSHRISRGLVELEDLRDYGVRIISIDDKIDYPNVDNWLKIQLLFLMNYPPVTKVS